jgi:group I intron endonuclease
MKGFIYKITNPNNLIYIGCTKNIKNRLNAYKHYTKCNVKTQKAIYNSLVKYGWEAHKFEIIDDIELCEENINLINEREIYWISKYDSYNNGLNCTKGGSGRSDKRKPMSEETKKKISESQKARCFKHSEEVKKKMSEDRKGNTYGKGNSGNKYSDERKKNMSENQMGVNNPNWKGGGKKYWKSVNK